MATEGQPSIGARKSGKSSEFPLETGDSVRLPMSPREEREERQLEKAAEEEVEQPLCYDWCGLGLGFCLRVLGHDGDCSPIPDVGRPG